MAVQSMCATKTRDVGTSAAQAEALRAAGAGVVRLAVDSEADVQAIAAIRKKTGANLSVDLQENYRLAEKVAPHVDKIRYNPGHLHHHEKDKSAEEKVAGIVSAAREHGLAVRIGVNCGSVDPVFKAKHPGDPVAAMVESALAHCAIMDSLGFDRYLVSLKDSDPANVIEANRRFAAARPDVPLHLGVTEAGLPPGGIMKTRRALEPLLAGDVGDTLRMSLTLPRDRKVEEVREGLKLLEDVAQGRFIAADYSPQGLNIISCPSCSRVENEAFVSLAEKIREACDFARDFPVTVAVMGCRVNGPGETDEADLGLWCGADRVHLKRGEKTVGVFRYEEAVERFLSELKALMREKGAAS